MHITYGIIYYFLLTMMGLTLSLVVFMIRGLRKLVFNWSRRKSLGENKILSNIRFAILVLIFIILFDSISSYYRFSSLIQTEKYHAMEDGKIDYLDLYKKSREFYLAERNFMLTGSALLAYYIFQRMVAAIDKLNGIENDIEEYEKANK